MSFFVSLLLTTPSQVKSSLFLPLLTLVLLGLYDDYRPLKPYQKFLGQCGVVCWWLYNGYGVSHSLLNIGYATTIISALWLLTVINAFNLVDVMDGLATLLAITGLILYFILGCIFGYSDILSLIVALLGALIGFFYYNKPPARIYLGDAGSLGIGGFIAIMPMLISWEHIAPAGILIPPLIVFIPLAEVIGLVVVRRYHGLPFYKGSRHHFCHYLQDKGWSIIKILLFCGVFYLGIISVAFFLLQGHFCMSLSMFLLIVISWIALIFG